MTAHVITKQMGITHSEFLRLLPNALASADFQVSGTQIDYYDPSFGDLKIELGPEGVRKIALFELPTTKVTLTFAGASPEAIEKFLVRFDRAYQRGGG